ncbi:MAG: hypothetical protein AAB354_00850 [candidate division KSB1 bacterium]
MFTRQIKKRTLLLWVCLLPVLSCNQQEEAQERSFRTSWLVKPALKFEVCNLIGILLGREPERSSHPQIYREWQVNLPGNVKSALVAIDQIIGPNWPAGPRLSLFWANLVVADSLAPLLAVLQNEPALRAALLASDYGSSRNWTQWLQLRPHVEIVVQYLISSNFENYWRSRMLPELTSKMTTLKQELQAYDVVGDIERFLRDGELRSDTVTIYILALAQPHELRLTSQSRYTDMRLSVRPVVRNFYQEMLHPYCDRMVDSTFVKEFSALQRDPFLQECWRRVLRHGGSNNFVEFIKKEVVLAATLWLAERRQLVSASTSGQNYEAGAVVRNYLREKDEGAHALAAIIYSYLESGLKIERVPFSGFIKDLFATGRLQPGRIAMRYEEFMNDHTGTEN